MPEMNDMNLPWENIELRQATVDEKSLVSALLQDYLREMLEYIGVRATPGAQPYPYLDAYWSDEGVVEGRVPFLILAKGDVAGFAFRNEHSRLGHPGPTSNVAEFYIRPEHRRYGAGKQAAHALFDRFPGRWEVAQLANNTRARHFWRPVIDEYMSGVFEEQSLTDDRERNWIIDVFIAPLMDQPA